MRGLITALAFGLALLLQPDLAAAAASPDKPPLSLTASEDGCIQQVRGDLQGGKTADNAVTELYARTADIEIGACKGPPLKDYKPLEIIAAVEDAVGKNLGDYGCKASPETPVCEGLAAVSARAAAMQAVLGPDGLVKASARQTGLLDYSASLHWDHDYLAFGNSPATGFSLLRLVLKAGPARSSASAAGVSPSTVFVRDFRPQFRATPDAALPCDDLCARSTAQVVSLYPLFIALDTADQPALGEQLGQIAAKLEAKRQRWDAYHFGGGDKRVQLPWELAVNGVLFNLDRPRTASGAYEPFPDPPTWALTVLHPSVGLALKNTKGADSNIVGVVELLGVSKWSYGGDNKRSGEWGLSAVAAYQPRNNGRSWGYGVLARLPWQGLNVAWVRARLNAGGHDDQFLLSVDISQLFSAGGLSTFKLQDPGK